MITSDLINEYLCSRRGAFEQPKFNWLRGAFASYLDRSPLREDIGDAHRPGGNRILIRKEWLDAWGMETATGEALTT